MFYVLVCSFICDENSYKSWIDDILRDGNYKIEPINWLTLWGYLEKSCSRKLKVVIEIFRDFLLNY
jgi:hypothetical protein